MSGKSRRLIPYVYVLPILIFSGLFLYYAIGFAVYTSLHEWDGISKDMRFIGFENYVNLLNDPVLYTSLKNVFIFFLVTMGVQASLGLFIAILFRVQLFGATFFKAVFFIPVIMSPVVIAAIFRIILDPNVGDFNLMLEKLHLGFLAQSWLGDPHTALLAIMGANIFQWMGFSMLLYYSSLLTIPAEIYEAATIDGSGFWNTLFRITVPILKHTHSLQIVMGILGSLKTFEIVFLLTGGGPGHITEFPTTYLYQKSMEEFNGGMSSTIGIVILVLAVLLSVFQLQVISRGKK